MYMIEAGLIEQWYKKYKTPNENCLSHSVKDETSISFTDIEGIVIVFISGLGLAIISFTVECSRKHACKFGEPLISYLVKHKDKYCSWKEKNNHL